MQKTGFFTKIIFSNIIFKVSAWPSNHAVCKIGFIHDVASIQAIAGVSSVVGPTVFRKFIKGKSGAVRTKRGAKIRQKTQMQRRPCIEILLLSSIIYSLLWTHHLRNIMGVRFPLAPVLPGRCFLKIKFFLQQNLFFRFGQNSEWIGPPSIRFYNILFKLENQ
jgi:hypothetical protein